eukprot:TRINITY_DN2637_c0_g1_i1.p1 TRINITY_DN2637_c0_g1~~TRINITY_DN2637_c0_g1_i1.p1  ORF type:complete len:106 (-),score=4.18 TRINITY_DN2637_c0_g1_i1:231-548(-)
MEKGSGLPYSVVIALSLLIVSSVSQASYITKMYSFGDSTLDVGTLKYDEKLVSASKVALYYPYGLDYIVGSGRFCNGKLVIDYLGNCGRAHHLEYCFCTSLPWII